MTITNEILMRTKPIIITWLAMFYCTAYAQVKSGQQEFRDGDALWRQTVNDFTFFPNFVTKICISTIIALTWFDATKVLRTNSI